MREIRSCTCPACIGSADVPEKMIHHQINLLMSRLDEQQRRWYAALECKRHGRGGLKLVQQITGLDEKTIQRGLCELEANLENRPTDRVRLAGAGRPPVGGKS